jgi:hypothetical protein
MSYPSSYQLKIMSLERDHGFSALEYQYSAERISNQNGQLFFKKRKCCLTIASTYSIFLTFAW